MPFHFWETEEGTGHCSDFYGVMQTTGVVDAWSFTRSNDVLYTWRLWPTTFGVGATDLPMAESSTTAGFYSATGVGLMDPVDTEVEGEQEEGEQAIPWSGTDWVCEKSGTITDSWLRDGTTYYDYTYGLITWSGRTVNGVGTIDIYAEMQGKTTASTYPDTLSVTGAIKFGGVTCGTDTISGVARSPTRSVGDYASCSTSWDGSSKQIKVMDGSSNARWEFIRGSTNHKVNRALSGYARLNPLTDCWYE